MALQEAVDFVRRSSSNDDGEHWTPKDQFSLHCLFGSKLVVCRSYGALACECWQHMAWKPSAGQQASARFGLLVCT